MSCWKITLLACFLLSDCYADFTNFDEKPFYGLPIPNQRIDFKQTPTRLQESFKPLVATSDGVPRSLSLSSTYSLFDPSISAQHLSAKLQSSGTVNYSNMTFIQNLPNRRIAFQPSPAKSRMPFKPPTSISTSRGVAAPGQVGNLNLPLYGLPVAKKNSSFKLSIPTSSEVLKVIPPAYGLLPNLVRAQQLPTKVQPFGDFTSNLTFIRHLPSQSQVIPVYAAPNFAFSKRKHYRLSHEQTSLSVTEANLPSDINSKEVQEPSHNKSNLANAGTYYSGFVYEFPLNFTHLHDWDHNPSSSKLNVVYALPPNVNQKTSRISSSLLIPTSSRSPVSLISERLLSTKRTSSPIKVSSPSSKPTPKSRHSLQRANPGSANSGIIYFSPNFTMRQQLSASASSVNRVYGLPEYGPPVNHENPQPSLSLPKGLSQSGAIPLFKKPAAGSYRQTYEQPQPIYGPPQPSPAVGFVPSILYPRVAPQIYGGPDLQVRFFSELHQGRFSRTLNRLRNFQNSINNFKASRGPLLIG